MPDVCVLALRLAGPLQAWGTSSRFTRRLTSAEPSKSGVVGLLAAATGRRRTDEIEDLAALRFAVRVDQPGTLLRDFQTASRPEIKRGIVSRVPLPLSERYYLADAVFLALVEGPRPLVHSLDRAVRAPGFPLYLGRRSCPPAGPVACGWREGRLEEWLQSFPWQAGSRLRRTAAETVRLATVRDALPSDRAVEREHDVPLSFDPNRRRYGWRNVVREHVVVHNADSRSGVRREEHDPMSSLL